MRPNVCQVLLRSQVISTSVLLSSNFALNDKYFGRKNGFQSLLHVVSVQSCRQVIIQ